MTAGSTLDKVGPMCRHAQDCAIVLQAIAGRTIWTWRLPTCPSRGTPRAGRYPKRIGYVPWMFDAEQNAERRENNSRVFGC